MSLFLCQSHQRFDNYIHLFRASFQFHQFSLVFLFSFSLISALLSIVAFVLLAPGLLCSSFSMFLRPAGFFLIVVLIFLFIYLFGCAESQQQHVGSLVFIAAFRIFLAAACGTQFKPRCPAVGARSVGHWTTREAPRLCFFHLFPKCL